MALLFGCPDRSVVSEAVHEVHNLIEDAGSALVFDLHRARAAIYEYLFHAVELSAEMLYCNAAGGAVCPFEVEDCFLGVSRLFHGPNIQKLTLTVKL